MCENYTHVKTAHSFGGSAFWGILTPGGTPIYGGWRSTKQYIIRRETDGGLLRYLHTRKIVFFRVFYEKCKNAEICNFDKNDKITW